jgi:hypothetical protein
VLKLEARSREKRFDIGDRNDIWTPLSLIVPIFDSRNPPNDDAFNLTNN